MLIDRLSNPKDTLLFGSFFGARYENGGGPAVANPGVLGATDVAGEGDWSGVRDGTRR